MIRVTLALFLALGGVASAAGMKRAAPADLKRCPVEQAVYHATRVGNSVPDELRIRYSSQLGLPAPAQRSQVPHATQADVDALLSGRPPPSAPAQPAPQAPQGDIASSSDDWPTGPIGILLKSAEMGFELKLDFSFTNGSGVISVLGEIPFDKLPKSMRELRQENHDRYTKDPTAYGEEYTGQELEPLEIGSIAVSIYEDFEVGDLPHKEGPTPKLIIFPAFRGLAHNSTIEAVSIGMIGAAFMFHHCEPRSPNAPRR